jgi:hypothetical protein
MSSQWHVVTLNRKPARGEVFALSHAPRDYSALQVAVAVAVAKALDRGALFVMQPPEEPEDGS